MKKNLKNTYDFVYEYLKQNYFDKDGIAKSVLKGKCIHGRVNFLIHYYFSARSALTIKMKSKNWNAMNNMPTVYWMTDILKNLLRALRETKYRRVDIVSTEDMLATRIITLTL